MIGTSSFSLLRPGGWRMALTVTRREVRDSIRDWRIVIPIIILTLAFPLLMTVAAERIMAYVTRFNAAVIGDRLIPFLLMVVGFFPTSFSLVIALETFVGEKERKSLEPLLATPLTNRQLYLGKMLAALVPPLSASFLGIAVYSVSIALTMGWSIPMAIFLQILALTTIQGVIMVAGAVVISSQTTSVRAANLLASFIIVPMALLIQLEAAAMFWGERSGLWWLLVALVLVAVILVRMGITLFNREELLGRELDKMRLGWAWGVFWRRFRAGRITGGLTVASPGLLAWYGRLWSLIPQMWLPLVAAAAALGGGLLLGGVLAGRYPLPGDFSAGLSDAVQAEQLEQLRIIAARLPLVIFLQNVRALLIGAFAGVFSLGLAGIGVLMLPWTIIGYVGAQLTGGAGPGFLLAALLPHGLVEVPAMLLAAAAALRWHAVVIAPPEGQSLIEAWLGAAADFARIFLGLVVPLLLVAAFLEAYLTPLVLVWFFDSG